jgi:hypothetical protein
MPRSARSVRTAGDAASVLHVAGGRALPKHKAPNRDRRGATVSGHVHVSYACVSLTEC